MEAGSIADWVSGIATTVAVWLACLQYRKESIDRTNNLKRQNQQRESHLKKVNALLVEIREFEKSLKSFIDGARHKQKVDEHELDKLASKAAVFDNKLRLLLPSVSLAVSPSICTFKSMLLNNPDYRRFRLVDERTLSQFVIVVDAARDVAEAIRSVVDSE